MNYKDKRKKYYEDHKEWHAKRMYRNNMKRKYGLSLEQVKAILSAQKNRCEICKKDFSTMTKWNGVCIDHNHKTGVVRGILCRRCNLSLAYIEDNKFLERAQNYLRFKEVKDKEPSR